MATIEIQVTFDIFVLILLFGYAVYYVKDEVLLAKEQRKYENEFLNQHHDFISNHRQQANTNDAIHLSFWHQASQNLTNLCLQYRSMFSPLRYTDMTTLRTNRPSRQFHYIRLRRVAAGMDLKPLPIEVIRCSDKYAIIDATDDGLTGYLLQKDRMFEDSESTAVFYIVAKFKYGGSTSLLREARDRLPVVHPSSSFKNIFHSSDALILIKFGRGPHHYMKNEKGETAVHDPLDDFELQSRIMLCDAILKAKQFMPKNDASYTKKRFMEPMIKVTKWDLQHHADLSILNYQRSISSLRDGADSAVLQYVERSVRMGNNVYRTMKGMPCVRTSRMEWFVTFGLIDRFMYLLEVSEEKANKKLRMVGILEPRALLDNRDEQYFEDQYLQYRDEMESICLLGSDDRLRLCSAILDRLSDAGATGRSNYVKNERRYCLLRDIEIRGQIIHSYFLRCELLHDGDNDDSLCLFHVLADSNERGAAFVFVDELGGALLSLHARVVKIGALMNPVGPREVQLNASVRTRYIKTEEKTVVAVPEDQIDDHDRVDTEFVSWREREEKRKKRKREAARERKRDPSRAGEGSSKSKSRIAKKKKRPNRDLWEEGEYETSEEYEYILSGDDDDDDSSSENQRKKKKRKKKKKRTSPTDTDDEYLPSEEVRGDTVRRKRRIASKKTNIREESTSESSQPEEVRRESRTRSSQKGPQDERQLEGRASEEDYDGGEEEHEAVDEEDTDGSNGCLGRKSRELSELGNVNEVQKGKIPLPPEKWGKREKRSTCTYDDPSGQGVKRP